MTAGMLEAVDFARYPPLARHMAETHLELLRQLPVPFAAVLLRELSGYDWQFPAERTEVEFQLRALGELSAADLASVMATFQAVVLSPDLMRSAWAAQPGEFVETMTAFLWSVHAIDAFHAAAVAYGRWLDGRRSVVPTAEPSRWCAVVVGRGARGSRQALFSKLRPHGTLFTAVREENGLPLLLDAVRQRSTASPATYAHWYVDGGAAETVSPGAGRGACISLSYQALGPLRSALLRKMYQERTSSGVGPEQMRSALAEFHPDELSGMHLDPDPVLRRFQVRLLTEGSGTQIFSTTFVQWAAREILRRARPETLLLRYAPRQVDRPMDDLLAAPLTPPVEDAEGSLVDADMGAYYTWLNLSRLSSVGHLTFLAWFEEGNTAIVIAPGMPKGTVSTQACDMAALLRWTV